MPTGKQIFVRTVLTTAMPFLIVGASVWVLIKEIGKAFRYAWQEVRIEWNDYLNMMGRDDY